MDIITAVPGITTTAHTAPAAVTHSSQAGLATFRPSRKAH